MASIESEVIDPSAAIERFKKAAAELAFSRRSFMGMGVAGAAAAGAVLLATPSPAQEPLHNGYPQVDVLNFLLQVKYITATLYSYLTTGSDLPAASGTTVGSAQVFNPPKQITFTSIANGPSAQQLTDMFNEMFYDELSHVIDLRNLIQSASPGQPVGATAVASRANLNLLGNSLPATTPPTAAITMTQSQAIAMSRMLEDLSVSAAAGAAVYLTGTNLAYVSQMMAADGFHAGALRLVSIQAGAQYQPTEFPFGNVTSSAETLESIAGFTTATSKTIYAMNLGTAAPSVGNIALGTGLSVPQSVIASVVDQPSVTPYGIATSGSATITNVSDTSTILSGQPISGTGIPANAYVKSVTANTITISANASATTKAVTLSGATVAGSNVILGATNVASSVVGQQVTGTGIPANTMITAATSSPNTLVLSNNATASSTATFTGDVSSGNNVIKNVSSFTGITLGLPISGAGIPSGATVAALDTTDLTVTISVVASATATGVTLTCATLVTLTIPTELVTVGQSSITLTGAIPSTSVLTLNIVQADSMDVVPGDPGSASASAGGPSLIAGTSPSTYQGFFNTAGAGSTSATGTQAGLAFARNFSQVLQVLLGTNATNTFVTNQSSEGGFYPYGVTGTISSIQPF
jgi:hypothetical protein